MLDITEKKLEKATVELQINVPVETVELEYRAVFNKLKNRVTIDGFRKGKAPLQMVETRFRKEADREVAENLLRSVFLEAVREKQLTPIAYPHYEFDTISPDEPFTFKAVFEVPPAVKLGKYKGIAAEEQACVVSDEDLSSEIDSIRERFAQIDKRGDDEVIIDGDLVKIKVKRIDDVDASERDAVEFKEYQIVVGRSADESALDKFITGIKVNEEKEIDVKYPKDYHLTELAGQKVRYHVVVLEISSMTLPELTDEFAKRLGYETVAEFIAKTREYLEKYVADRTKGDAKAQILRSIVEDSTFDLPESMILNEMESLFRRTRESVGYHSDNLEEFAAIMGLEKDAFVNRLREEAAQSIKTSLVLSEIAKNEELAVDPKRYAEVIENIAKRNGKTVEEIEKAIAENNSRETIESELLLDGAMELIYENAKVKMLKPISYKEFAKARVGR
ncbi:MAG: trigger factor [Spirochaetes bacterium RBG_13_51_14]|nr:MAG: trigger factor [Spirochaetes bacterium RBG_13_51_14]